MSSGDIGALLVITRTKPPSGAISPKLIAPPPKPILSPFSQRYALAPESETALCGPTRISDFIRIAMQSSVWSPVPPVFAQVRLYSTISAPSGREMFSRTSFSKAAQAMSSTMTAAPKRRKRMIIAAGTPTAAAPRILSAVLSFEPV